MLYNYGSCLNSMLTMLRRTTVQKEKQNKIEMQQLHPVIFNLYIYKFIQIHKI